MGSLRRQFGFWPTLLRTPIGRLLWPEGAVALLIGGAGGLAIHGSQTLAGRVSLAGDFLSLLAPLIAVVFTGFALVASLLSDSYIAWLRRARDGITSFTSPFLLSIGIEVGAVLLTLGYRAAAASIPLSYERAAFVVLCFVVVYALLDVVALARSVLAHSHGRALDIEIDELESTVASLKKRQTGDR